MFGSISRLFKSVGSKKKKEEQSPFAAASVSKEIASHAPQFDQTSDIGEAAESYQEVMATGDMISLPLPAIMKQIPSELLGIDASTGAAKCKFCIPKQRVAKQLETGAVKVSFGEVRKSVPVGIFINTSSGDDQEIHLPLHLIVGQVGPEFYQRRQDQQIKKLPDSIEDLFGPKGQGLADVRILKKEEMRSQPQLSGATEIKAARKNPIAFHASPQINAAPSIPSPRLPSSQSSPSSERVVDPPAEPASVISGSAVLQALAENQGKTGCESKSTGTSSTPTASRQESKIPSLPSASQQVNSEIASLRNGEPATHLSVGIGHISASWPKTVLDEIEKEGLNALNCDLPVSEVKIGLQQGKVSFSWSQIRAWITSQKSSESSLHGDEILSLPLNVITPLFLRSAVFPVRQTYATPSGIPDVFANQQPKQFEHDEATVATAPQTSIENQVAMEEVPCPTTITEDKHDAATANPSEEEARNPSLNLALASVSATWPSEIQHEIQSLGLASAHLAIPAEYLEAGLRSGKVESSWRQVLAWIVDGPEDVQATSSSSDVTLKLPLDIIAPLYLQLRQVTLAKKASVPSEIPDVFSAKGEPPPPTVESKQPEPTTVPVSNSPAPGSSAKSKPGSASETQMDRKRPRNIAELFGEPKKKSWTPNEIIQRTAQMQGVSGALIALQDGLLVAGCLPPGWKTETLAAFIPQMFGRMSQYTRELSMGNLRCLTLCVEKGPVQVYSAGLIYFAVLGNNGTTLPTEDLAIIANELSRHTK